MKRFTIIEPLLQIRHLLYFHGLKFSSFFLKFLLITVQLLYISLCFFLFGAFCPRSVVVACEVILDPILWTKFALS